MLKATEAAAVACFPWIGRGQSNAVDGAAVDAMRQALADLPFSAKVVIGEGERDKAPQLHVGELLGTEAAHAKHLPISVAVDPLEGTKLAARGEGGSMSTIAIGGHRCLLQAPDIYMDKLATRGSIEGLSLGNTLEKNLKLISQAKKKPVEKMQVCVMDRERNQDTIDQLRKLNTQVFLIKEGDVGACIDAALGNLDLYIGIGAAPEGVISAAALNCLGGTFLGKLTCYNKEQKEKAISMKVDLQREHTGEELAKGDVAFIATGVTGGKLLEGVKSCSHGFITHSVIVTKNSCQHVKTKVYNR